MFIFTNRTSKGTIYLYILCTFLLTLIRRKGLHRQFIINTTDIRDMFRYRKPIPEDRFTRAQFKGLLF